MPTRFVKERLNSKDLSTSQIAKLQAIAQQCPFTGGSAVEVARGLLVGYGKQPNTIFYNNAQICK